jgi:hypothetical protein
MDCTFVVDDVMDRRNRLEQIASEPKKFTSYPAVRRWHGGSALTT